MVGLGANSGAQPKAPAHPAAPSAGAGAPAAAQAAAWAPAEGRYTEPTPDAMVSSQKARALAPRASEGDVLAAIAVIQRLDSRATYGVAVAALDEIAASGALARDLRDEAFLAARRISSDAATAAGREKARSRGVLSSLLVVGPFRDTGGGLDRREGPEESAGGFGDRKQHFAWGAYDVSLREVPPAFAGPRGVPLDVFVAPRRESCSYVASKIDLRAPQKVVVRVAAAGQVRLAFDGEPVGKSDESHRSASFDRVAARVDAAAGPHAIVAKVCAGALSDEGHVRLRVTNDAGAPVELTESADLAGAPSKRAGKAEPMATPLARALAAGDSARPEAKLAAAVVRGVGGADDQRSPRAAGLVDAAVRAPGIGADALAMAAWVSPSGANRSSLFVRARAAADSVQDARTTGFVERRLVAEQLGALMPDWAMATWRGAKTSKADAEAALITASVAQGLGLEALRADSYRTLLAEHGKDPAKTPTALVFELARMAPSYERKRAIEVERVLEARGLPGVGLVNAAGIEGVAQAARAANEVFEGRLDDADEAITVVRALAQQGAHDAARPLARKLLAFAPNRAEAWVLAAHEIALAPRSTELADPAGAAAFALGRARELSTTDAQVRAELELRTAKAPGGAVTARDDEKYLVGSATLLSRRRGVPAGPPDVSDRQLYWLRAVTMHDDNRVSQLIHYAREIVIAPRTQNELFEDIPAEGELTEILRARVHRKDGGVAFPTEEHNDGRRPRIRWPELAPGDTVEVAIRSWTSTAVGGRGDAPFYFLDYVGAPSTHPLLYNEVIVETRPGHPLYVDVLRGTGHKKTESDEGGRHVVRYVWDKPEVVQDEPLAPPLSETVPVIVGSTFRTWDEFRKWYMEAIRGFTEPDDEVRRLAKELTKGKNTREEKLRALFDFVADDIRYVNYTSGEWWLPNRPQQLLARRAGDCDDKALLLITLLKSIGIEAEEVMVQTRLTGQPSVVTAKNVAVPMFDHGIAFLPGPGGGQYLDATSPQSRLGPLPSMDARAMALRMQGPPEIVQLPASSPEDHGADVVWSLALDADGAGDLVGEETHAGDGAFYLRTYLSEADARLQYVEDNLVGPWLPAVEVDKAIDFKGNLPQGKSWVRYKARSLGVARREQGELVVPISPPQTLASQLAPLVTRTLPLVLPSHLAPSHQTRTLRITAPPGFTWAAAPPGGDVAGGELGKASLEVQRDPRDARVIVVKRNVTFNQHWITVEKYAAFRGFIQKVDGLMHKSVRLVPDAKRGGR
ncbi:MAG: transglutaminase domain-containing protein [Myxococcales bacterium]|nr:transglutaminase domain-containing protein [Myxococcales bacterium]